LQIASCLRLRAPETRLVAWSSTRRSYDHRQPIFSNGSIAVQELSPFKEIGF